MKFIRFIEIKKLIHNFSFTRTICIYFQSMGLKNMTVIIRAFGGESLKPSCNLGQDKALHS
jgi:hypothetical protein